MKQKRQVNIRDVARQAGVSPSTVSRVMNNPTIVRAEKRDLVLRAIRELGFIPDPTARTLGARSMRTVAIVVPNIINSCMAQIVRGAMDVFRAHHMDVLLLNSDEDPEMESRHYQYLTESIVHGVVFITNCGADVDFGRIAGRMPVVLVDREESHELVDTFIVDDRQGVRTLYRHLWEQGHRKIGLLSGNLQTPSARRRRDAFREMVGESGQQWQESAVESSPWTMEGGRDAFGRLLDRRNDLSALICCSDILAMGALGESYRRGIRVPDDLAITGFDDFPEGRHTVPELTTLAYPHEDIGRRSAMAVIRRFSDMDRPGRFELLPLALQVRGSSARPKKDENDAYL